MDASVINLQLFRSVHIWVWSISVRHVVMCPGQIVDFSVLEVIESLCTRRTEQVFITEPWHSNNSCLHWLVPLPEANQRNPLLPWAAWMRNCVFCHDAGEFIQKVLQCNVHKCDEESVMCSLSPSLFFRLLILRWPTGAKCVRPKKKQI